MIADKMKNLVKNSSAIRAMFEEGKKMAQEYGAENVYDFSLGNPNVPAPPEVKEAIIKELNQDDPVMLHGYMSNSGYEDVRKAVADSLNKRFGTAFHENNIVMTVGAAGGLNVILKAILNPGDQVLVFAPYFGEYNSYVENYDGEVTVVSPNTETFQPNLTEMEEKITEKTKAVIVNTPNNPSGVVYSEETVKRLGEILRRKSEEYGSPIYLITDEPYREIVYDDIQVPYLTKYYENTLVCYSYSKSLSLPGERIGYIVIPDRIADHAHVAPAIAGAARVLGYVCAPILFQKVIEKCVEDTGDLSAYRRNRDLLMGGLEKLGYTCVPPQGAFYLFVKALEPDAYAFCEHAKKYDLLLVPSDDFGCPGYVRIAYCVSEKTIVNAMPAFEKLMEDYRTNAV